MSFIDYRAITPREEIANSLRRTPEAEWENWGSVRGRSVCLLKVGIHACGLVVKPLYYLLDGAMGLLFFGLMHTVISDQFFQENGATFRHFRNHPELAGRATHQCFQTLLCAPAAVLSQAIQVTKAAAGILYPGVYFRNDEFAPFFQRLEGIAIEAECSPLLIEKLGRGPELIQDALNNFPHRDYYQAQLLRDLRFITEELVSS